MARPQPNEWMSQAWWDIPYDGSRYPGSSAVRERPGVERGANCQLFAYAVLARAGLDAPPLRSAELWADRRSTVAVSLPRPLDLLLFNRSADPYGAHVGVWLGEDAVLHLCREIGRPALWTLADFAARERYGCLIGVKRVRPRRTGVDRPSGG